MTSKKQTIMDPGIMLSESIIVELFRAKPEGGYSEPACLDSVDLVVENGMTYLAKRIGRVFDTDPASGMDWMAIGSATTVASFNQTNLPGEMSRKQAAVSSATSNNVFEMITTWGGAADSLTGLDITEAGIFNHPNSGNGTMFQRVTFTAANLAASDILKLTLQTNVGSRTI